MHYASYFISSPTFFASNIIDGGITCTAALPHVTTVICPFWLGIGTEPSSFLIQLLLLVVLDPMGYQTHLHCTVVKENYVTFKVFSNKLQYCLSVSEFMASTQRNDVLSPFLKTSLPSCLSLKRCYHPSINE